MVSFDAPQQLSEAEKRALTTDEIRRRIAEFESYNYIRRKEEEMKEEQERVQGQWSYRGGRGGRTTRGRGRSRPYHNPGNSWRANSASVTQNEPTRNGPPITYPLTSSGSVTATSDPLQDPNTHQIQIGGISFQVADDGRRLIRVARKSESDGNFKPEHIQAHEPGPATTYIETPEKAICSLAIFVRTPDSNMLRVGFLNDESETKAEEKLELCSAYTATGMCVRGKTCKYKHDPLKIAICKEFLSKGLCTTGDDCNLSHLTSAHNSPHCLYFLRGNCTNDPCRYTHVNVSSTAPVCNSFGRIGYCEKGPECTEKHVFECPNYANTGDCPNSRCRNPHIDRAGKVLRAMGQTPSSEPASPPGTSAIKEQDSPTAHEVDTTTIPDDGHEEARQQDFIPLT